MDSLIEDAEFSDAALDIDEILAECGDDFNSGKESWFVGIALIKSEKGYKIKARHTGMEKPQLMIALEGAINLFFSNHS